MEVSPTVLPVYFRFLFISVRSLSLLLNSCCPLTHLSHGQEGRFFHKTDKLKWLQALERYTTRQTVQRQYIFQVLSQHLYCFLVNTSNPEFVASNTFHLNWDQVKQKTGISNSHARMSWGSTLCEHFDFRLRNLYWANKAYTDSDPYQRQRHTFCWDLLSGKYVCWWWNGEKKIKYRTVKIHRKTTHLIVLVQRSPKPLAATL